MIRGKSIENNKNNWKFMSMSLMSISMTTIFIVLMSIIQKHLLNHYFYEIFFSEFPNYINNMITYIVLYFSPVVALNYFSIFKNDRYKRLINKYPYHNGKLFLTYFMVAMVTPLIVILTGMFLSR
jgi:hypothetical protein